MKGYELEQLGQEFNRDLNSLKADLEQLKDAISHLERAEEEIQVCGNEIKQDESLLTKLGQITEENANSLNKDHIRDLLDQIGNLESDLKEVDSEITEAKEEVENVLGNVDNIREGLHSGL